MKKSFLFSLMAILLAGFGFGGISLADDLDCSENAVTNSGVVACINDTGYTTLLAAISAAADNAEIVMQADYEITQTNKIQITKNLTIDLNGKTITKAVEGTTEYIFQVNNGKTFTIKDTGTNGKISRSNGLTAIMVLGTLEVENGIIESVNGCPATQGGCNGSTIAIKVDENGVGNYGEVIINGGTINGGQAVQSWGLATINGGTLNGEVNAWSYQYNGTPGNPGHVIINNGATINGDIGSIQYNYYDAGVNHGYPAVQSNITINGGTINGTVSTQYRKGPLESELDNEPGEAASAIIEIQGGIFSTEPDESYIKDGYCAKLRDDSKYEIVDAHTVTWKNYDDSILETDEKVAHGSHPSYDTAQPTKPATSKYKYTFAGWTKNDGTEVVNLSNEEVTEDTIYKASFTEHKKSSDSSSSSNAGGGSSSTTTDTNTGDTTDTNTGDTTDVNTGDTTNVNTGDTVTEEDKNTEENKDSEENKDENLENNLPEVVNYNPNLPDNKQILADGLTPELHYAYNFAFENGITTMPTIQEAEMETPLNRIAMAKMLSQYAINILGKTPDTTKTISFPDVSAELDAQYNNGVTLAYQLGIMGIGIDEFRPFDLVTRAEFVTALSRMLYGLADGEGLYYETHMQKLLDEKIITVADPNMKELRGYVMIMLMRSSENE